MAKFPKKSHFFNLHDSSVAKLRSSSVLYRKTKSLSEVKICVNFIF